MNHTVSSSDMNLSGWINYLPVFLRPYALLIRLDRPIGSWLLFLPGLWGILLPHHITILLRIKLIVLFGIGSIVMRGVGCIINDIWDRDFDRQVSRTQNRPLIDGTISLFQAIVFLGILLFIGLCILLQLNKLSLLLGASSLILVVLYPGAKRVTWWPQLVLGFTFGFGAPLGYAAAAGYLSWAQAALYGATIFWQLGFDTIYGYLDIQDDQKIGVKSTSRLAGDNGRIFIAISFFFCMGMLMITHLLNHNNWFAIATLFLPALHFLWQIKRLDIHHPDTCLLLFRSNRDAGLLIALSFLVGNF